MQQWFALPWDGMGDDQGSLTGFDTQKADELLISGRNHHEDSSVEKCEQHRDEMHNMRWLASMRKVSLLYNFAFLQFM